MIRAIRSLRSPCARQRAPSFPIESMVASAASAANAKTPHVGFTRTRTRAHTRTRAVWGYKGAVLAALATPTLRRMITGALPRTRRAMRWHLRT
jgi:hypothetical protein